MNVPEISVRYDTISLNDHGLLGVERRRGVAGLGKALGIIWLRCWICLGFFCRNIVCLRRVPNIARRSEVVQRIWRPGVGLRFKPLEFIDQNGLGP